MPESTLSKSESVSTSLSAISKPSGLVVYSSMSSMSPFERSSNSVSDFLLSLVIISMPESFDCIELEESFLSSEREVSTSFPSSPLNRLFLRFV